MNELFLSLRSREDMYLMPPAHEEDIKIFEARNNISLPLKFREWLKFSDGGDLYLPAGVQIYGAAHKPLIDIADDDRPDENYVVIGAFFDGDPVMFKLGTEEISIYNHEAGRIEPDEKFQDFYTFIKTLPEILGI